MLDDDDGGGLWAMLETVALVWAIGAVFVMLLKAIVFVIVSVLEIIAYASTRNQVERTEVRPWDEE
jgi:uncharacterized membrane protein